MQQRWRPEKNSRVVAGVSWCKTWTHDLREYATQYTLWSGLSISQGTVAQRYHDNFLSTHDHFLSTRDNFLSTRDNFPSIHDNFLSTDDNFLSIHDNLLSAMTTFYPWQNSSYMTKLFAVPKLFEFGRELVTSHSHACVLKKMALLGRCYSR